VRSWARSSPGHSRELESLQQRYRSEAPLPTGARETRSQEAPEGNGLTNLPFQQPATPSHDLGLSPELGRPLSRLWRGAERRSPVSTESPPCPSLRETPPRWLAVPTVRIIRLRATVPTQSPSACRDSTFSRPPRKQPRLWPRAREGTRWGVNGDSDPSGSTRQQQKSRRSTGSPRAGSEGDGTSPPAAGSGSPAEIRGTTSATVIDASRTSEKTAPNPGTSWRGALGETGGRPNARTARGRDARERPVGRG
jgi:hypothetical protein